MDYGTTQYGLVQYAETIVNSDDIKKYFINLNRYIPDFIYTNKITKAIYDAQGAELGSLYYCIDDLLKQCFIDTATWGLTLWEEEFGITTNLSMSYEQRREILKAKRRGQGTVTKDLIKNVAEAFSGGECKIIEHNEDYYFTIQFIGIKGIPRNMQGFINAIEDIKPAHLGYIFQYTYTTWNLLKENKLTWNNAKAKSWNDLKVYE